MKNAAALQMAKRRKKRKLIRNSIIALAVCIFAVVIIKQQIQLSHYNSQIKDLTEQVEQEQKVGQDFDSKKDIYASDSYIEKIARETLGLIKADEKFFVDLNGK